MVIWNEAEGAGLSREDEVSRAFSDALRQHRDDLKLQAEVSGVRVALDNTRDALTRLLEANAEETRRLADQASRATDLFAVVVRYGWALLAVLVGGPDALRFILAAMSKTAGP